MFFGVNVTAPAVLCTWAGRGSKVAKAPPSGAVDVTCAGTVEVTRGAGGTARVTSTADLTGGGYGVT